MALKQDIGTPCLDCGEKCRGFKIHGWRKTCLGCDCSVDRHDVTDDSPLPILEEMKLIDKPYYAPYMEASKMARKYGLCWLPIGLQPSEVEQFTSIVPGNIASRAGEKMRKQKLRRQIPVHDRCVEKFSHLESPTERQEAEKFLQFRNNQDLGVGHVYRLDIAALPCAQCQSSIQAGQFAVRVDHAANNQMSWHPRCFKCTECDEVLVDFIYCWYSNKPYCIRHYAQLIRPRCATCDELIFTEEYTRAMEQEHHPAHFACKSCDNSLTGHRYILKDDQPLCISCYESQYANICQQCNGRIGCDSKDLSFKDRHWHEKCFKCFECSSSLVDQPFATKDNNLYCSDCYDNKFATRCDGCHKVFKAGMRKYEYRGKQWHEECFLCVDCRQPIGTKSFIPREQDIVCVPCYEEKYAQKCTKCVGVIRRGGVTYKGSPWHKECFTCTHCSKQLAGIKFTSKEEKPYCAECYGELFAKKCSKCSKPITGFGGCKFISFEDRHWHSECFTCYKCNISLVGKGFLTNDDKIICPDCGR